MKISLLEINMNPKIELKIISTLNKTLLLSKPNYYPILIISLYDLNGKPYSPSKIHSSIILKKEVFNLEVNKEKIFEYKSLKSLYPFVDYRKVSKIVAVWYYNAFKNDLSFISDTLIINH